MLNEWRKQLTNFEKIILQKTYDKWKNTAEWPKSLSLAIELRKVENLYKAAKSLGYEFIHAGEQHQKDEECKLTILGVALCKGSENDLENFVKGIQYLVKKYIKNPEKEITTDEIQKDLSLSDLEASKVSQLIREESGIWSSAGRSQNGKMSFNLAYSILMFEDIKSIDGYFNIIKNERLPSRFTEKKEKDFIEGYYQYEQEIKSSIFLSHSHADKDFVNKLAKDLKGAGYYVWTDYAEIKIGDSLIEKIREGIDKVDYVGVVISRNSINSEWVKKEVDIAMTQEIEGRRVKVLPILLDDVKLPGFLESKKYADFKSESLYKKSLNEIEKRLDEIPSKKADFPSNFDFQKSESCMIFLKEINTRSKLGQANDPFIKYDECIKIVKDNINTDDPEKELELIVYELVKEGLIYKRIDTSSRLGFAGIGPTEYFFCKTDSIFQKWDPKSDAKEIVKLFIKNNQDSATTEELDRKLKWGPRRLNSAIVFLYSNKSIQTKRELGGTKYVLQWIRLTEEAYFFIEKDK